MRSENCTNCAVINEKIPAKTVTTNKIVRMILKALPSFQLSSLLTTGLKSMEINAAKARGIRINLP